MTPSAAMDQKTSKNVARVAVSTMVDIGNLPNLSQLPQKCMEANVSGKKQNAATFFLQDNCHPYISGEIHQVKKPNPSRLLGMISI